MCSWQDDQGTQGARSRQRHLCAHHHGSPLPHAAAAAGNAAGAGGERQAQAQGRLPRRTRPRQPGRRQRAGGRRHDSRREVLVRLQECQSDGGGGQAHPPAGQPVPRQVPARILATLCSWSSQIDPPPRPPPRGQRNPQQTPAAPSPPALPPVLAHADGLGPLAQKLDELANRADAAGEEGLAELVQSAGRSRASSAVPGARGGGQQQASADDAALRAVSHALRVVPAGCSLLGRAPGLAVSALAVLLEW